jgi:hypothetical protein
MRASASGGRGLWGALRRLLSGGAGGATDARPAEADAPPDENPEGSALFARNPPPSPRLRAGGPVRSVAAESRALGARGAADVPRSPAAAAAAAAEADFYGAAIGVDEAWIDSSAASALGEFGSGELGEDIDGGAGDVRHAD